MGMGWGTTFAMHSVRLSKLASTIVCPGEARTRGPPCRCISSALPEDHTGRNRRANHLAHPCGPPQPDELPRDALRLAKAFKTTKIWFECSAGAAHEGAGMKIQVGWSGMAKAYVRMWGFDSYRRAFFSPLRASLITSSALVTGQVTRLRPMRRQIR